MSRLTEPSFQIKTDPLKFRSLKRQVSSFKPAHTFAWHVSWRQSSAHLLNLPFPFSPLALDISRGKIRWINRHFGIWIFLFPFTSHDELTLFCFYLSSLVLCSIPSIQIAPQYSSFSFAFLTMTKRKILEVFCRHHISPPPPFPHSHLFPSPLFT